ncbi:MAG: hypothetical protein FWG81_10040 [Betaproteobacteria bacterium]|nr:hypothetical protein [Betaproteobacteria bacterium]
MNLRRNLVSARKIICPTRRLDVWIAAPPPPPATMNLLPGTAFGSAANPQVAACRLLWRFVWKRFFYLYI